MANKAIFSYGNGGERKIGHSKFDMGHEHIMSSNFGALQPAAVFETLPDDYWNISDNTVTLLKPMTAPAFTRINQNFYGAYVRNQQIWKYWNDYISNGTAFGDVYGNNVTNQSLQNAWDVPSIPTPYLQTILKMGNGCATPVFSFEFVYSPNGTSDDLGKFIGENSQIFNVANSPHRITDLLALLLQVDESNSSLQQPQVLRALKSVGFQDYGFDLWVFSNYPVTTYRFLLNVYCSLRQFISLRSALGDSVASSWSIPSTVGENVSSTTSTYSSYLDFAAIRFFADRCSSEVSTVLSPFVLETSNYIDDSSRVLKSIDFYPRVNDSSVVAISVKSSSNYDFSCVYQNISNSFWGFRYHCTITGSTELIYPENHALPSFNSSTSPYWAVQGNALFGVTSPSAFQTLMESFGGSLHYLGVGSYGLNGCLDMFLRTSSYSDPLAILSSSGLTNYSLASSFGSDEQVYAFSINSFLVESACDLVFPVETLGSSGNFLCCPNKSFASRESLSLGYDGLSFIFYLAKNSSMLLDSLGLKVDPLTLRPFSDYRFELTNALPFFAYSKIWNDNFRNSVVSSPELDYSESNSVIFADSNFYNNFVFATPSTFWFLEPAVRPSRYVNKVASDFTPTGWTLEITTFPRNAIGSAIHTHFPINRFSRCMSILLGCNFLSLFAGLTNTELNVFDYYIPSYYNGLLHLKFQNFNKDYFTSALLDPMSGANQVQLGSTVNELRQAEAEQHWWERTAMYRSIKSWFQGTYGITPIELPEDSRITGSDHVDIQIGEVIQTSGSTPESPQGTRTGLGGARGSGNLCHGHCNEHGWIFILISHTIESQYSQAYDKMWDVKESFLDYPTIDFAGIGNESILQKEVNYTTQPTLLYDQNFFDLAKNANSGIQYLPCASSSFVRYRGLSNPLRNTGIRVGYYNIAKNAGTSLDNIFGFIPRYSSYKFKFDQVSGQFRNELKFWHTFKRYLTSPILCHEFVNWEMAADDDDINRIFAVSDDFLDDKFAIDCFINATVDRALPFVCVPMTK